MTESATAETYRDQAIKLREEAKDMLSSENRAHLRFFADNYDYLATSIEKTATAHTILLGA